MRNNAPPYNHVGDPGRLLFVSFAEQENGNFRKVINNKKMRELYIQSWYGSICAKQQCLTFARTAGQCEAVFTRRIGRHPQDVIPIGSLRIQVAGGGGGEGQGE